MAELGAGGDVVWEAGVEFGEAGVEDAGVGLRDEDGDPAALFGQFVAVRAGDALDEAFAAQAAQVVPCPGTLRRAVSPIYG